MKKILVLILVMAPLSLFAQKFGFVDAPEIAQVMPEFTKAENELKTLQKQYSNELEHMRAELEMKSKQYEELKDSLPANILQRRERELQDLYTRMQEYAQASEQNLVQAQQTKLAEVNNKLQKAIQDVGREGGYICVFDISSGIPYISETLCDDLNAKVRAKLGITAAAAPVK